jgi:lipopolysaccharide biosynthesis protein
VQDTLAQPDPPYVSHRTVMPGWDNTARMPNLGNTFVNASPEVYEVWLREIVARAAESRVRDERLVFINAWNEWAEGAHLEPDRRYGRQYLEATRRALSGESVGGKAYERYGPPSAAGALVAPA